MKCNTIGCKAEATFHAEYQGKEYGKHNHDVNTCEKHIPTIAKDTKIGEFYGFQGMKIFKVIAR